VTSPFFSPATGVQVLHHVRNAPEIRRLQLQPPLLVVGRLDDVFGCRKLRHDVFAGVGGIFSTLALRIIRICSIQSLPQLKSKVFANLEPRRPRHRSGIPA
jgi:hypothetical protein